MNPEQVFALAVLGKPIHHSLSPRLHNQWLQQAGLAGGYVSLEVTPDNLTDVLTKLSSLGFNGCNLTLPLKETVLACGLQIYTRGSEVEQCQAANTVSFRPQGLALHNTDIDGLAFALARLGLGNLRNRKALLIGAGGASRAFCALAADHDMDLLIANRTESKARTLATQFGHNWQVCTIEDALKGDALSHADLIIQATSAWTTGDAISLPEVSLTGKTVLDLGYGKGGTVFSHWARSMGANADDGLAMLVGQAAKSFAIWTGVEPDVAAMMKDLGRE